MVNSNSTILSVGLVLYNEEKRLPLIQQNIQRLFRFSSTIELIVVDNLSMDSTLAELKRLQQKYQFKLLQNTQNHLGDARKMVIKNSSAEWVGFFDADCVLPETWLSSFHEVQKNLLQDRIVGIGGGLVPGGSNQETYERLFSSFLGHFNSVQARPVTRVQLVDHLPTANVFYLRKKVVEAGNFSSEYKLVGEDIDLSQRLIRNGGQLLVEPSLNLVHILPDRLLNWLKKIFRYGYGRMQVAVTYEKCFNWRYILPLCFLLGTTMILTFMPLSGLLLFTALYLLALAIAVGGVQPKPMAYLAGTHFAYSLGMLYYLFSFSVACGVRQIHKIRRFFRKTRKESLAENI